MKDLEIAVQLLGGDTNKVIYDDIGMPSIMVRFDKGTIADVITGGSENTHPAFSVNGVEIPRFWYSKYQNVRIKGSDGLYRAYSLPLQDPQCAINFDTARGYCENKGNGWHLATNAEWAWIALQCRANGFMPRGNNSYGADHSRKDEKGIATLIDTAKNQVNRVATGSGPKSWAHNNHASGVWDMNGNVNEWIGGYRTVDGEIQVIPYNNAADKNNPQIASSTLWKAIMPDGSLVDPGAAGTLHWDFLTESPADYSGFRLNNALVNDGKASGANYGSNSFAGLKAADGVLVPEIMKALALFPADSGDHGGDYIYMNPNGERLAYRGGCWNNGSGDGVFYLVGYYPRTFANTLIGFRSAFVEL